MSNPKLLTALVTMFLCVAAVNGDSVTVEKEVNFQFPLNQFGSLLSVENGYMVFLQDSKDASKQAQVVNILDSSGKLSATLDVLRQIETATDLSIYDVSVGKSGLIAVSVVAIAEHDDPMSLLLVYDAKGVLLRARKLEKGGELGKIRVDSNDSIWALRLGLGGQAADQVYTFYQFTSDAASAKGFCTRRELGLEHERIKGTVREVGVLSFGITDSTVWCWLPETQELLLFSKDTHTLRRFHTGLPTFPNSDMVRRRINSGIMTDTGELVAPVGFLAKTRAESKVHLMRWKTDQQWEIVPHAAVEVAWKRLVGVEGDNLIFAPFQGSLSLSWERLQNR